MNESDPILPLELLEAQLAQIELLLAMYPTEGTVLNPAALSCLRTAIENNAPSSLPPSIDVDLSLEARDTPPPNDILVHISFPLCGLPSTEPPPRIRLGQSSWMSKAERGAFAAHMVSDDLFTAIEAALEPISTHLQTQRAEKTAPTEETTPVSRVWFYFPSISTRSKRDDIVLHAPRYGLTGFLLAGKPGILCLEGESRLVDEYMRFIKTESWGDIPAHHKKVSERYRQEEIVGRVFSDMCEITDQLERRGERANRNDMRELEAWLAKRGLGEAFERVFI